MESVREFIRAPGWVPELGLAPLAFYALQQQLQVAMAVFLMEKNAWRIGDAERNRRASFETTLLL